MSGMTLKLPRGGWLTGAGRAGPRRLLLVGASFVALTGLVVVVTTSGGRRVVESQDAHMGDVDPLPGGTHGTPEMNQLAFKADTQQASAAMRGGRSFTPELVPSVPVRQGQPQPDLPAADPAPQPKIVFHTHPIEPVRVVIPTEVAAQPDIATPPPPRVIPVQATVDPNAVQSYNRQIGDLFSQWGGRLPQTEVVTPAVDGGDNADNNRDIAHGARGGCYPGLDRQRQGRLPCAHSGGTRHLRASDPRLELGPGKPRGLPGG